MVVAVVVPSDPDRAMSVDCDCWPEGKGADAGKFFGPAPAESAVGRLGDVDGSRCCRGVAVPGNVDGAVGRDGGAVNAVVFAWQLRPGFGIEERLDRLRNDLNRIEPGASFVKPAVGVELPRKLKSSRLTTAREKTVSNVRLGRTSTSLEMSKASGPVNRWSQLPQTA